MRSGVDRRNSKQHRGNVALWPLAVALIALGFGACTSPGDPAEVAWNGALELDSEAAYRQFVAEHGASEQAELARQRLAEGAREREEDLWWAAIEQDEREGYESYLAHSELGSYADEARARMDELERGRAYRRAAEAGTAEGWTAFLEAYPTSPDSATAAAALGRLAEEAAFEEAEAEGDLAGWEAFVRRFPEADRRVEVGRRVEALGADHPVPAGLRPRLARFEAERLEQFGEGVAQFACAVWELGEVGEPLRFLIKDEDHRYLAIDERAAVPFAEGFERPALRYLPPRAVCVVRVPLELVSGRRRDLEQGLIDAWSQVAREFGLDFEQTRLKLSWPEDPIAGFGYGVVPDERVDLNLGRAILGSTTTNAELALLLDELPEEIAGWARERIRLGTDRPGLSEVVRHHVAMGAWQDLELLGRAAEADVLRLIHESEGPLRRNALGGLAQIDATGEALEGLELAGEDDLDALLVEAIVAEPKIALRFEAPRARAAAESAAEVLARTWMRDLDRSIDPEERRTCRHLLALGYVPRSLAHEVHIRALDERWDAIVELGEPALEPLMDAVGRGDYRWGDAALESLIAIGRRHGPSTTADDLMLARGDLRALAAELMDEAPALGQLFGADARTYLQACPELGALAGLARTAPDPRWRELAAQWEIDLERQDFLALEAAGKLSLEASGNTITAVDLELANLSDHPLHVFVPSGLRFAPSSDVQNMITLSAGRATVAPGDSARLVLDASCANLERPVPGLADRFEIVPLDPSDPLYRVSQVRQVEETAHSVSMQAAIWAISNDASYAGMSTYRIVRDFNDPGVRAVNPRHAAEGLRILEIAGLDFRATRLWQDAEYLLEHLEPGELRDWLSTR